MKTSKYLFRILFFFLLIVTNGCKKEESQKQDTNEIIIAKEAKIINNQLWNENLISIDTTNFTLTLKEGINSIKIREGDIIVSSENEGLLRKVKQSNQIGDKIVIATEPAALSEVVKQGVIEYYQPLTTSQIKDVEYMYEGVVLITDLVKSNGNVFNWDIDAVLYDLDGSQATKNDQIKLVGTFNCDWRILLKIDIGLSNGLKEVKFGFVSNQDLNLKLIGGVSYEFEKDITLAKVNFNPIVIMVGAVPVVFTPQLKIMVGIDGYSEASISSEVSQNLSFDAGIHYLKGQGWSPFKTFEKSLTFKAPQLAMNASASMYLKPEFLIKVYSVAGPYANVKIYGKIDASLLKTPWWTLYGGIKMSAGAKVDILDKFLLDFTVSDLINMEQVLAQATTPPVQLPTITTATATNITTNGATLGGNVTSDGNASVTERGVVYSTTQNPTTTNTKVSSGSGTGAFTVNVSSLSANTTYYVRAYAINSQGTSYGTQISFKTGQSLSPATVTTNAATNITTTGATLGGYVTSDGNASVTERGVVYSTTQNPTTSNTKVSSGSGTGSFTVNLSSLSANTTYYVRAYAINSQGTAYGTQISFKTGQALSPATVTTNAATNITTTGATLGGNITSDGNATVTERGVVYSTTQNPTTSNTKVPSGSGTGAYAVNVSGLSSNTTYYVRAYAINSQGTAYGNEISFTLISISDSEILFNPNLTYGSISDIDGNVYKTIQIGTQVWMAENLKTTKYTNGNTIETTDPLNNISLEVTPKYQFPAGLREDYAIIYGRLYTWYTITDPRGVCPNGWHIPSYNEFKTLEAFLGGKIVAGGKLKEIGSTHWDNPNEGASNISGFTALPSGSRNTMPGGWFYLWTSTEYTTNPNIAAWCCVLKSTTAEFTSGYTNKSSTFSVRCIKD